MHQGHTETQHLKDKDETPPTVMVHVEQINETTSPFIPTEEECRQDTSEDQYLGFIKNNLSGPE